MAHRENKIKPSKIDQKLQSKTKVKKTQEFADEARVADDRFKAVNFDPRFAPIAKKDRKFKIDPRFSQVLSDSRFKTVGKVDKLGRKLNVPQNNKEMEEFYYLEGQEDGEDQDIEEEFEEEEEAPVAKGKKGKNDKLKNKEKVNGKVKGKGQVQAKKTMNGFTEDGRFEWNEQSSSESDMEDIGLELGEFEEEMNEELWENEEQDVPEGDPARRLAMVNYDWENTKASDIMLFLSSFVPRSGYIRNVKVYPSEFGLERMKDEEKFGPQGIWKSGDSKSVPPVEEETEKEKEKGKGKKKGKGKEKENGKNTQGKEQEKKREKIEDLEVDANAPWIIREEDDNIDIDPVKLRRYEQDRLKYYYAIIECDSVGTAKTIYESCDGLEMELTSIKIDLRYVPDDQTFQREPNEVCTEVPPTASVNCFLNRAVQHTNVKLTWDEPKVNRFKDLERKDIDDYDNMDLSKYIADSDSSDQDSEDEEEEITRKRELLLGNVTKDWKSDFDKSKKNKRRDEEIVIKFNPGFDELGNKILEKANPEKTKNQKRHQGKVKEDDDFFEEEEEVKTKEELKREEEMLRNMVDEDDDRKKKFKPNYQDDRFSGIYKESMKFQIDPTSKHYKVDDNKKWLVAQTTGRKKLKKE